MRTRPFVMRRRSVLRRAICAILLAQTPLVCAQSLTLGPGEVLTGRFTQTRTLLGFSSPLISTGSFLLSPTRGLVWRGETPFAVLTVMGRGGLIQHVENGATTRFPSVRLPFIGRLYDVFGAALSGDWGRLSSMFDVRRSGGADRWHVSLTPLPVPDGGPIRQILVSGGRFVEVVEIFRNNGDADRILFTDHALSLPLLDSQTIRFLDEVARP